MKFKLYLFLFCASFAYSLQGQNVVDKIDIRLGIGKSFLPSGDYRPMNYEVELNYKLNKYFTTAASFNLAKSDNNPNHTVSFTQGNLNLFLSPFKNTGRFDFRVGTGLTYYDIHEYNQISTYHVNGVLIEAEYATDNRQSLGCNVIVENTFQLGNRVLLGLKLFTQPYFNQDINSGVLIKLGIKLKR